VSSGMLARKAEVASSGKNFAVWGKMQTYLHK
jgi:hypothetical protein